MGSISDHRFSKVLIVLASIAIAGAMGFESVSQALVVHWENEDNPHAWARAARWEPTDAQMWWILAIHYERDPLYRSLPKAEECLLHAVHFDPSGYLYWNELGKVQEQLGKISDAQYDYERAEAAAPHSATVKWQYGSFLLRHGQTAAAAEQVQRALVHKTKFTESAVEEFWRSGTAISTIVNQVLPRQSKNYLDAITFFVNQQQSDEALACWKGLVGSHLQIQLKKAFPLIDELIAQNRIGDAHQVWLEALRASRAPEQAETGGSLIYNGDFKYRPLNGGFGWRQTPIPGAAFDLVSDVTHGSTQSARVSFDGNHNVDYANLSQFVAVEPGKRYRFSAYMRTEDISTDTGPQFQITGCASPYSTIAQTPGMTGTNRWTKVSTEFTAGARTKCVKVVLRRQPSQLFSNRIRGMVWVDSVRLMPVDSQRADRAPSMPPRPAPSRKRFAEQQSVPPKTP